MPDHVHYERITQVAEFTVTLQGEVMLANGEWVAATREIRFRDEPTISGERLFRVACQHLAQPVVSGPGRFTPSRVAGYEMGATKDVWQRGLGVYRRRNE